MHKLLNAVLATAVSMGAINAANAGPANAFTFAPPVVTAVSERVTYTAPQLNTYIGYDVGDALNNVLLTNTSGSTVNQFTLRFTASVVKPDNSLSQEKLTALSLTSTTDLSSVCAFDTAAAANPVTLVCQVKQLKSGDKFPAFTVFYRAPAAADSPAICAGSANPSADCNTVKTQIDLIYAEGPNDQGPTGTSNSTQQYPTSGELKLVSLGTSNPSLVKSALPKGLESKLFTGTGVPTTGAAAEFKEFTESVTLPSIAASYRYGQASIKVQDDNSGDGQCTNLGNFKSCPLYETTIVDPSTGATIQFLTAPLQFVYRIDASKLNRPLSQILSNTQIFYSATGAVGSYSMVGACTNNDGTTNGDGKPCVDLRPGFEPTCFKNSKSAGGIAELVGDCQWNLLKDSNGFVKFN